MIDGFTIQRWQLETLKLLTDNGIELAVVSATQKTKRKNHHFLKKSDIIRTENCFSDCGTDIGSSLKARRLSTSKFPKKHL